ncbi:MAG: FeoB-associated Cys-rich membrane protein [Lachnospiraceae bacterium]|nr:FeoB-associated Cys-rich membrane protein [Lachnospiraceae bacterium]
MSTVIISIIVFGIVGLDVWYLVHDRIRRKGKTGCGGCSGCCSGCGSGCSGCGGCH